MKKISKRTLGFVLALLIMAGAICATGFSVIAADTELQDAGTSSASGHTVYLKNSANWNSPNVYMWEPSEGDRNNGNWPGKAMTSEGDNIYSWTIDAKYSMIIFNGGGTQTGNMEYPGDNMIYDNSSGKWEAYDTSALKISKFEADAVSPQYTNTAITFTAEAKSSASSIQYQFSVNNSVVQGYSANGIFRWVPTATGTFTVKVDVKDNANNTNSKEVVYVINDPSQEVKPIFQSASPSNATQIKLNASTNISINAAGGNTGTKLLFYKYVVKNPSGQQINTAYYTLNKTYAFTPTVAGDYTVEVSVQGSDNQVTTKTLKYTATGNPITETTGTTATTPTTPTTPTTSQTKPIVRGNGDVDGSGELDINDALNIQKFVTHYQLSVFFEEAADVNGDGIITIADVTYIQKKLAGLI